MEYKKNAEEVKTSDEYKIIVEEQHKPAKEYFPGAEEYHSPAREYFVEEETKEATAGKVKTKKNLRNITKKVRQMGYLVAASLAVVTVSQTVEPAISQNNGVQDEVINDTLINTGDIAINVPGFEPDISGNPTDSITEVPDENLETLPERCMDVSSYEEFSAVNDGVILLKKDGLWGVSNLRGEVLCEPKYNGGYWWSPNDEGYSVVSNDGIYYILDRNGREIFVWDEPAEEVMITEHNIIYIRQYGEHTSDGVARAWYFNVDGTLLYEAVDRIGDIFEPTAFNDGIAMINMAGENEEWESPHMLYENGSIGKVQDSYGNESYYWVDDGPYTDGYYLGASAEGIALVDAQTGKSIGGPFWSDLVIDKFVPEFAYEDAYIKGYYENGQYLYNYDTYGCIEAVSGEETVNMIFDYRNGSWDDYSLSSVIAIYDKIEMDDFQYLLVTHNEEYFYIDWNGNVVSDIYADATAFNEDGYAMIVEDETAYLINAQFEKLDVIKNVTDVGNAGDVFGMEYGDKEIIYIPK